MRSYPKLRDRALDIDYCTEGHTQQEHETSHGSMSRTKWAVYEPDGPILEVNGRKFGTSDDGAPMLVSVPRVYLCHAITQESFSVL